MPRPGRAIYRQPAVEVEEGAWLGRVARDWERHVGGHRASRCAKGPRLVLLVGPSGVATFAARPTFLGAATRPDAASAAAGLGSRVLARSHECGPGWTQLASGGRGVRDTVKREWEVREGKKKRVRSDWFEGFLLKPL